MDLLKDYQIQPLFQIHQIIIDYQQCIKDIQTHGLSIICCDSLGYLCDEYDDNTLWQYLDNAVEIITNKYSSGKAAVMAFDAGIDLIMMPKDIDCLLYTSPSPRDRG